MISRRSYGTAHHSMHDRVGCMEESQMNYLKLDMLAWDFRRRCQTMACQLAWKPSSLSQMSYGIAHRSRRGRAGCMARFRRRCP